MSEVQVSEAEIAVHWREEEYFHPPAKFIGQANANDPAIFERFAETNFPECFKEYADLLTWDKYWHTTLDTSNAPFWKWFVGGKLNASYNCIDRHLAKFRDKAAFIWVPEPEAETTQVITYQELYKRVNEFAALLRDFCGLKAGDRVTFHLPMVPELPVSMLACARLGVIHSEVFGGFSGAACGGRIADSGSDILVTMDGYYRNGDLIDHKVKADEAVEEAKKQGQKVDKVLIWRRYPGKYSSKTEMVNGRDYFIDELIANYKGKTVEPVSMPAEAPLFLMYTSGTTAKPKGCQHSTGGYLAYVAGTSKYYQDIHPEDTYWCFADIGWITGHSYIVYGPLALAANFHFKHMTTVGEPIEPEVWRWYHQEVGKNEAVIVDTWWQTENGGFLGSTLPALQPMKPGSCGPGVLGVFPQILDEEGKPVPKGSQKAGNITIRNPWPGIFQTIYGDPDRFVKTYYAKYNKKKDSKDWHDWPYFAGDGALQAEDGYFRILGRVDDVINVAGHRLGTKELESATLTVEEVAEAAAVPVMDELRGRAVEMYVALKPGFKPSKQIEDKVSAAIDRLIGKIARPKNVWIVPDMPKTRSGKIMRRVIAGISNFTSPGDITTLANPEIVETIKHHVESEKVKTGQTPRELTEKELEEIKSFGRAE
ncbi:MAG: acetate--CoA ligase [Chloroflexi bacterium]|nr:MAG: acetate--CoA ligase [Chloroflexota bacterium]